MSATVRRVKLLSAPWIYSPGMFRWIREAVAPFDRDKAAELLRAMGMKDDDANALADPDHPVTTEVEGEDLLLEFDLPAT